jgi:DNA-directed RNA polymerase beta' subunit
MNYNNNNDDELKGLFGNLSGQWDVQEPPMGHHHRFMDRLEGKKKRGFFPLKALVPIAAAFAVMLTLVLTYGLPQAQPPKAKVSPQVKETQMYFASIIEKEMGKIKKEQTPETKKMVQDALHHMQELEQDYDKLTRELVEKGESKQIIHAMITNLQTRISFLEEVLTQIENIKKLKENYNADNQA